MIPEEEDGSGPYRQVEMQDDYEEVSTEDDGMGYKQASQSS